VTALPNSYRSLIAQLKSTLLFIARASPHITRSKHASSPAYGRATDDAGYSFGRIINLVRNRLLRHADLFFQVPPRGIGPPIGAGDPGRGTRIAATGECLVALAQLLSFKPAEAALGISSAAPTRPGSA